MGNKINIVLAALSLFIFAGCDQNRVGQWEPETKKNALFHCQRAVSTENIDSEKFCACLIPKLEKQYHPYDLNGLFRPNTEGHNADYAKNIQQLNRLAEGCLTGGVVKNDSIQQTLTNGTSGRWNPFQRAGFYRECVKKFNSPDFPNLKPIPFCNCLTEKVAAEKDFADAMRLTAEEQLKFGYACKAAN